MEVKVEQRSKEWHRLRLAKVGGSEAIGITTPARMKTLVNVKLAEYFTNKTEDVFVNDAMQHGIDTEPIVADLYEAKKFVTTREIGFVYNEYYMCAGLSPDRLIGDVGALEIKCPKAKTYISYVVGAYGKNGLDRIPTEHRPQITWYFMIMPKLEYLDYVVYNEDVTSYPMHITRVTAKDMSVSVSKMIANYENYEKAYLLAKNNFESIKTINTGKI
tara:strand:- start:1613 stop:2263 length:651 start_codon:yes stop_codon:yes gene_type:complete